MVAIVAAATPSFAAEQAPTTMRLLMLLPKTAVGSQPLTTASYRATMQPLANSNYAYRLYHYLIR